MSKLKKIILPSDEEYVQRSLFAGDHQGTYDPFPKVYRDEASVRRIVESIPAGGDLGIDFEFYGLKAEILGVAGLTAAAACYWNIELGKWVAETAEARGLKYVGHSVLSADKPILEASAGLTTPWQAWKDSLLTFWLAHHGLCKMPTKEEDTESLGLMNLGVMGLLHTDLPQWKICRGRDCSESYCPRHDVLGYCAIDSWVGLIGDIEVRKLLAEKNMSQVVIDDLHELQTISLQMQDTGTAVDHEYIKTLDARMKVEQVKLFPLAGDEGYRFNPKSPKEVLAWFAARDVKLKKTDKDAIQETLVKRSRDEGYDFEKFEDLRGFLDEAIDTGEPLSETVRALADLHAYKIAGKGSKSWFGDQYFGPDRKLHPRFVITGTSTGRLSSSRPNLQNVPKRGWGKLIRRAFVPETPEHFLFEADFSQLELRIILYLAGVDQSVIGADAFTWLVEQSGGRFERAAQKYGGKPRDIGKMVSHGSNYLMGFKLLSKQDLNSLRFKKEIAAGALRVYLKEYMPELPEDWYYGGKAVAFTGSHLAASMFGDKSLASRAKALEIQEDIYFSAFPFIRRWQQAETVKAELNGYVQSPTGRFLELNDTAEKNAKLTVAFLGQGTGADHATAVMLEFSRQKGLIFQGMIHDALVKSLLKTMPPEEVYQIGKFMELSTARLPGFTCPVKMEVGPHWASMTEFEQHEGSYVFLHEDKKKVKHRMAADFSFGPAYQEFVKL